MVTARRDMSLPDELGIAANRGELQPVVEWLQRGGGHVDALDKDGDGLLHWAASGGQLRVAKELLQRGASVDLRAAGDMTALMVAAGVGQHSIMRLLLEHKASVDLQSTEGVTALMMAACEGHQECVQELLEVGASTELRDQRGDTALQMAEANGYTTTARLLRQRAAKLPASVAMSLPHEVGVAANRGELQPVVEWLRKGGHVDALDEDRRGLLHTAAAGGRLHVAKELLKRGASVDLRGANNFTALIWLRRWASTPWCACCSSTRRASTCGVLMGRPP